MNGSQQRPSQSARNPRRTHVRPENDGRRVRGTTVTVGDESRAGTGSRDDKESPDDIGMCPVNVTNVLRQTMLLVVVDTTKGPMQNLWPKGPQE